MQPHKRWLAKAKSDLKLAENTMHDNDSDVFDAAIYHTQQCAEKALKAFLVFHKMPILKTHDLLRLLELCADIDKDFELLLEVVILLDPFSTALRYPNEDLDVDEKPTLSMFEDAVLAAQNLLNFVTEKIER